MDEGEGEGGGIFDAGKGKVEMCKGFAGGGGGGHIE